MSYIDSCQDFLRFFYHIITVIDIFKVKFQGTELTYNIIGHSYEYTLKTLNKYPYSSRNKFSSDQILKVASITGSGVAYCNPH